MTAKEALREQIERMSESEAAEWLARLEWESSESEELTPDELNAVLAGEGEIARGDSVDGDSLFRRLA